MNTTLDIEVFQADDVDKLDQKTRRGTTIKVKSATATRQLISSLIDSCSNAESIDHNAQEVEVQKIKQKLRSKKHALILQGHRYISREKERKL